METLRSRAPAKINLGLQVIRRRPDRYHELHFTGGAKRLTLRVQGETIAADGDNLVLQAAQALRRLRPDAPGVTIDLVKRIPVGAGLGGGSSDAAATLRALCRLWNLDLPVSRLVEIGRSLGADVPFFLYGGAAFASGRGDRVRPLRGVLDRHLVVAVPALRLATASVFDSAQFGLTPRKARIRIGSFSQALSGGLDLADLIINDLEETAVRLCPAIEPLKRSFREVGAEAVAMSGSGPTVFGLFSDLAIARAAAERLRRPGRFVAVASPLRRPRARE